MRIVYICCMDYVMCSIKFIEDINEVIRAIIAQGIVCCLL